MLEEVSEMGAAVVPQPLWAALERVPSGEAVEWRPSTELRWVIGCTRYRCGDGFLLLMKEVSEKHAATHGRLHGQRLEAIGRLVASIAHELRNSVASIVYSADLLGLEQVDEGTRKETLSEILEASKHLQAIVDGLLDYARLGPTVSVPVSLREVLTRSQGFLRSVYRDGSHQLAITIPADAEWVVGNSLVIEQIFVNLLLNAAQITSDRPVRVQVRSESFGDAQRNPNWVRVTIADDGPGVPGPLRNTIFEPFFTTRVEGTGLGLTNAREAAELVGGSLTLTRSGPGATFVVELPAASRPPGGGR